MNIPNLFRYLSKPTVYQTVPIYNLNWIRSKKFYANILRDSVITLVDVGARAGSAEELAPLEGHIAYIGFDADAQEVARLNAQSSNYLSAKYVHCFVSNNSENVEFKLHHDAGDSSIFDFSSSFSTWFIQNKKDPVAQTLLLKSDCLDNILDNNVDIIKLDTQGNEFEILDGATRCLQDALLVEIEVEFFQMYEKQKLAHDVMNKMYKLGYELLYLNRVFRNSVAFKGLSRGQMIFGDALFGVSREKALTLSVEKQKKYCALLINYGHLDFAFDIYKNSPRLADYCRELGAFFECINERPSKISRLFKFIIDKIVFIFLYTRKTNGVDMDSDRSWPIR